jgi:outer membrane usher protein
VLGVGIEKSARKLAPGERLSPTVGSTFAIERPSDVDVVINGAITQRLRLKPGNYSIRDLPLAAGANDIELIIMDDRGQRRYRDAQHFRRCEDARDGQIRMGGERRTSGLLVDGERTYRSGDYLTSGLYRFGLTDKLSLEAQIKGGSQAVEGGIGVLAATSLGVFGLSSAVSTSDIGVGIATNVSWGLGQCAWIAGNVERRAGVAAHWCRVSQHAFRTPGDYLIASSGILYPKHPIGCA